MVIAFIFLIHIVFVIYVFVKRMKNDSLTNALIDLILIVIIFSVGWSLSTMFCKMIWDQPGFGKYFDRDTISLTLLTLAEFFFYRKFACSSNN
jgi:hypothetical protein